jgi:hypothetical protein
MPGEGAELLPRGHVPELDRLVVGPGGEDLPVRGEGHREDPVRMPGEGAELRPRGHVPELDRLVIGPGGEDLPVRGEGHRADRVRMPGEEPDQFQGLRVAELDPEARPHCQIPSIRGEDHIPRDPPHPEPHECALGERDLHRACRRQPGQA